MNRLERDTFAGLLQATVEVTTGQHGELPLRVDRVEDYGDADGSRFSVFLSGPVDKPLGQGTYQARVAREPFWLFLVPVAREGERLSYEAAFNRSATA